MNLYDDTPLQLARLRQAKLQIIANQLPVIQLPALRQRLGNAIVRFGQWVAKNYPEIAAEPAGGAQAGLTHP